MLPVNTMDEAEYCKKLQQVFEFLLSSACHIHDDTLYHKLLDSLNGKMIRPGFAESCGVIDFLQRAGNNTDVSPDTLVFAVQLVEKLVSKTEISGIHLNTVTVLIKAVALRTSTDNLSVFCALFKTLTTILRCPCVMDFCLNIDFQDILKKSIDILKEERSIFLSRAVSDFICSLFTSKVAGFEAAKKLLKELQTIIVNYEMDASHRVLPPSMLCSLRVIERVPHLFNDSFAEILDVLILLMKEGSTQSSTTAARCLHSLCQCQDRGSSERVRSLVSEAIHSVHTVKSLHIAKVLYPLQLLERSALEDIILKPLKMLDETTDSPAMHSSLPAVSLSLTVVNDCYIQKIEACKCVAKVLKLTENRQDDFSTSGCNSFTGSSKLQVKCLDYLGSYACKEVMVSVVSSISNIIAYSTEHMIYRKCLHCLCRLLPEVLFSSLETSTVKSALCTIRESIQRNFCSVEWEFRDTSCEFVRNLTDKHKDKDDVIRWMLDSRFHVFACQAVSDGESYVRATSLSTLQTLLLSSYRTKLLQDMDTTMDEIISQVVDVCETDSEAFPRRSAATLLHHCLLYLSSKLQSDSTQAITQCFSTSLPSDFDWEVKLTVVEFWCAILKRCFDADLEKESPNQSFGIVVSLECSKIGDYGKRGDMSISTAVNILLKLSCDYDPSVSEKVCQEFCWIYETLKRVVSKISSATNDENRGDLCTCAHCTQLIIELLNRINESKEKTRVDSTFKTDYDLNAVSLLDDILSLDCSQEDKDEDNAIDCY